MRHIYSKRRLYIQKVESLKGGKYKLRDRYQQNIKNGYLEFRVKV